MEYETYEITIKCANCGEVQNIEIRKGYYFCEPEIFGRDFAVISQNSDGYFWGYRDENKDKLFDGFVKCEECGCGKLYRHNHSTKE